MKIIVQNYGNGMLEMLEVPMISAKDGLLVETKASLVSIGTEKAMIDVAKKSLIGKALLRPDWVKQVIDKIKTEGIFEAWNQSKARLDMPIPLGYSCSGVVREVYNKNSTFKAGDRVACTGSGFASHAEWNVVPENLCTKIKDNVSFEDASYAAVGGIAMQAIRLAKVEFGHKVGVIGLGLVGQLALQILKNAGCTVLGVDIEKGKCELAKTHGADVTALTGDSDPVALARSISSGYGLDSVIIFASVKSNEPLILAADMCREKGIIVAGGLIELSIPREIFYKKELEFCVSRAWGPGMYDVDFEQRDIKYPYPYVRWTASNNIEEFVDLIAKNRVSMEKITTHTYDFNKAMEAYDIILNKKEPVIGLVLKYGERELEKDRKQTKNINREYKKDGTEKARLGIIGTGLFLRGTILPILKGIKYADCVGVASTRGLSAASLKDKLGFSYSTSDYQELLKDDNINCIMILTRHSSHSKFICEALIAGKSVFVEKPLCINKEQLKEISEVYEKLQKENKNPFLMVGFNRRFAPLTIKCIDALAGNTGNSSVIIRCNAGYIPADSWVHNPDEGGGRIVGEVCHFVDLAQALTTSLVRRVYAIDSGHEKGSFDNMSITLSMENSSVVTIQYTSFGQKSYSRERVEVFSNGMVFEIDNFKKASLFSAKGKKDYNSLGVDRGHKNELVETFSAIKHGNMAPISFKTLINNTLATFGIEESIRTGKPVDIFEIGLE